MTLIAKTSKAVKHLPIASRILLAIVGGYGVAVLTDLACLALPIDQVAAIYWGYLLSLIACAAIIILAFSTVTAKRAWIYVSFIALVLFSIWQLGTVL